MRNVYRALYKDFKGSHFPIILFLMNCIAYFINTLNMQIPKQWVFKNLFFTISG